MREKDSSSKKMPKHKLLKPSGKSSNLVIENRFKTPRGFGNAKASLKTGK